MYQQKPAESISKKEYVKRFKALCDAYEIKLPNREYDIYHLCHDLSKLSIDSGEQKPSIFPPGFGEVHWNPISSVQQKSVEWSEEDETHRDFILETLEDQIRFCKKDAEGAHYVKQIRTAQNWLKSRSPFWKPSEEQMGTLERWLLDNEFKGDSRYVYPIFESLYNDLKKLM